MSAASLKLLTWSLLRAEFCFTAHGDLFNPSGRTSNSVNADATSPCVTSVLHYSDVIMGVSNHRPHDCLLNSLFKRRSKKTSMLRVTGLCVGNSPVTGEFPAQMASNVENVFIWWRHHGGLSDPCLPRRRIPTFCTISVLRNDKKCKYVLILHKMNSPR